jgi:hypothetical protein
MGLAIKIFGPDHLQNQIDGIVLEQNATQNRTFGLEILRRNFAEVIVDGCHRFFSTQPTRELQSR